MTFTYGAPRTMLIRSMYRYVILALKFVLVEFQIIHCAEVDCKTEVCYLKYLDHFKEKHGKCEDLGDGKIFKSPISFEKIKSLEGNLICSDEICKTKPLSKKANFKKCENCSKVFCLQGLSLIDNRPDCGYHYCTNG